MRKRIRQFIKSLFGQKSSLERFLKMEGQGVRKISVSVGQYNRLDLLLNNSFILMEELLINYKNTGSNDDSTHLSQFLRTNKPRLISITSCVDSLFNKDLITKVILTQHVHTVILKKCQISKDNCVLILQEGRHLKSLVMQECGIQIDNEIAQAVSDLPDETMIDLSGNKIVKMRTKLLTSFINKIRTQNIIELAGGNIEINIEIAKAVCDLPVATQIDLSGNKIVKMDRQILVTFISKVRTDTEIDLSGLFIRINDDEARAVMVIPDDDTKTHASDNKTVEMDFKRLMSFIYKIKTQKEINLSGLNVDIDSELVEGISELPEDVQIDLSDNKIADESLIVPIVKKSTKLKSVTMRNCGIEINEQIAEAISELKDDTKLDLSGNYISKDARWFCEVFTHMKEQEEIYIYQYGITIDVDIVKAVSNMTCLKSIVASCNTLTPSANIALPQAVRSLTQLEMLYLGGSIKSNDVCVELVSSLSKSCPRLRLLDITDNNLSSGISQVVDDVSKMKNLRFLRLWGNPCVEDSDQRQRIGNKLK